MTIYFIRHSESFKSVGDIHGGAGLPLTDQGKLDILDLVWFLENKEKLAFDNCLFYCSDLVQVLQTAKAIEAQKNVVFQVCTALRNISLGILDGLSKEEALNKYPIEASNLEKWRKGEIKINDFVIPNAETLSQFYSRVFEFIFSAVVKGKDVVIVGTRSVGVAVANIFAGFSKDIDIPNYKRFLFHPSSVSKFIYENKKPKIVYINRTDFLSVPPRFPDQ